MRIVKQRLKERVPDLEIFLDVRRRRSRRCPTFCTSLSAIEYVG